MRLVKAGASRPQTVQKPDKIEPGAAQFAPYVARQRIGGSRTAIVLYRMPGLSAAQDRLCVIHMDCYETGITRVLESEFNQEYAKYEYDVKRAAQIYLHHGNGCGLTDSAHKALSFIVTNPGAIMSEVASTTNESNDKSTAALVKEAKKQTPKTVKHAPPAKKGKDKKATNGSGKKIVPKAGPVPARPKKKEAAAPVKKGKATKATKATKAVKKGATTERQPRTTISDDSKIKLIEKNNPKHGTAAQRYALYKDGMTVAAYRKAAGEKWRTDIWWDSKQGWIKIIPAK